MFFPLCDSDLGRSWTDMVNSLESLTICGCFLHKQMLSCVVPAKVVFSSIMLLHTIWNYIHFVEWVINYFNFQGDT